MLYRVAVYQIGDPISIDLDDEDDDVDFAEQFDIIDSKPDECTRNIPVSLVTRLLIAKPVGSESLKEWKVHRLIAAEAMRRLYMEIHAKVLQLNAPDVIIDHWGNPASIYDRLEPVPMALSVSLGLDDFMIDENIMGLFNVVVETSLPANSPDS